MTMENITLHNQEGKETIEFGQGFSETQIRNFCKFYLTFSGLQIRQTVPAEFKGSGDRFLILVCLVNF